MPIVVVPELEQEESVVVDDPHGGGLTLALNLVLSDVPRALLLLSTLPYHLTSPPIKRLLLIVPDHHYHAFTPLYSHGLLANHYPTTIIPESLLLHRYPNPSWDTYAIQMALKLLVSTVVDTDYYLTLDADVLAVGPLPGLEELLLPSGTNKGAVYVDERCVRSFQW